MRPIASFVSYLFNPLIICTLCAAIIIFSHEYRYAELAEKGRWGLVLYTFLMTFVIPTFAMLVMKGLGFIQSLKLEHQNERVIPFITCGTWYLVTYLMFRPSSETLYSDGLLSSMLLGATFSIFICFIINTLFSKISLHAAGWGGLFYVVLSVYNSADIDMLLILVITIILGGLVGTSRLILNAHSIRQVGWGYVAGMLGQMVAFKVF